MPTRSKSIHELKEELRQEKETREELEERIAKLENENKTHKPAAPLDDMDSKLVSELKRMLIEHDKHDAKNVVVNYKWFHARLRDGMGHHNVATVTTDGRMEWMDHDGLVNATVEEAMAEFEANME